jgi:hypothetical protein
VPRGFEVELAQRLEEVRARLRADDERSRSDTEE